MKFKYVQPDRLMCLLLPKKAALLPWRSQPTVCFAYTYSSWKIFADNHSALSVLGYRYNSLTDSQRKSYCYADASLTQYFELVFSGESASSILATDEKLSDDEIAGLLLPYMKRASFASDVTNAINVISKRIHYMNPPTVAHRVLSAACLLYNFEHSLEGDSKIWTGQC